MGMETVEVGAPGLKTFCCGPLEGRSQPPAGHRAEVCGGAMERPDQGWRFGEECVLTPDNIPGRTTQASERGLGLRLQGE